MKATERFVSFSYFLFVDSREDLSPSFVLQDTTRFILIVSTRSMLDSRSVSPRRRSPRENRESTTYCTRARSQIDQIALYYENVIEWNKSYSGCV